MRSWTPRDLALLVDHGHESAVAVGRRWREISDALLLLVTLCCAAMPCPALPCSCFATINAESTRQRAQQIWDAQQYHLTDHLAIFSFALSDHFPRRVP